MQPPSLLLLILLSLSINVSALPSPQKYDKYKHLPCYEDNPLRALERFTSAANGFCPGFLSSDGKTTPPQTLGNFHSWEFYSACSCYEKTATGDVKPTSTPSKVHSTSSRLSSSDHTTEPNDPLPAQITTQASASAAAPPSIPLATENGPATTAPSSANNPEKVASPNATTASPAIEPSSGVQAASAASTPAGDSTGAGSPAGPINPASKGKRGIAYNYKSQPNWSAFFKGSPYAVWGSNWDDQRTDALDLSFTYVPTIVVDNTLSNSNWLSNIPALIKSGSTTLFGSNEPDNAGQANLPASAAATVHQKYLQPFAGQAALGTPAVTNGGSPSGLTYLDAFATACANCTFNFINVHFYLQRSDVDTAQFASALKTHLDVNLPAVQAKHENLKGLPIMLGEFWLTGASDQEGVDLLLDVLPYLDGNDNVMGYQAFGGLWEGNWINSAGTGLTPAAQKYNTYSAPAAEASTL